MNFRQIVEVGNEVSLFNVGDRVIGEPHTKACGKSVSCAVPGISSCAVKNVRQGRGIDGAFAKYLVMPDHLLHQIPDTMSFEDAAVVEPAANVVQDVLERARVEPNDFVVVNGPGR